MLKVNILILAVCLLLLDCNVGKSANPIAIQVRLNNNFDFKKFKEGEGKYYSFEEGVMKFYGVEIEIKNNSDSLISFWEMFCSWPDNWIFNDKRLNLYPKNCTTRNFPTIRKIEAHKKIKYEGLIYCKAQNSPLNGEEFKLGLIWIGSNEYIITSNFNELLANKRSQKRDIIWSNLFKLKDP